MMVRDFQSVVGREARRQRPRLSRSRSPAQPHEAIGRINYVTANDKEAIGAFFELSRVEGIIPALESAHAVAYAIRLAPELDQGKTILVNLSGRGDKDIDFVTDTYGKDYCLD